jgi:hypothetical protein
MDGNYFFFPDGTLLHEFAHIQSWCLGRRDEDVPAAKAFREMQTRLNIRAQYSITT